MPSSAYLLVVIVPAFFAALWLGACWFTSLGGWHRLSDYYRSNEANNYAPGTSFAMQSGRLRNVGSSGLSSNYRASLNIRCQSAGLQLSVVFLFAFRHPPLLVPWSAIKPMGQESVMFGLGHTYNFLVALPDGAECVELKLTSQQLAETITSYQQSATLGKQ
ncbi:hypothetical protein MTX78_17075 [Hymenobacter tibetensis]|uniref:Uncharacterized protein n=1 Tax=Hymenobacter tibetensis TaxID=497967 RepID=A0ABY4D1I3_9BACT|nr:hypothetical protein [Hymenobacter tibetensis]UOG73823.1 hypothetical protein MTX78_17075 [Hymenobacter tibetensis]